MKKIKTLMLLIVFAGLVASAVLIGRSRPVAAFGVGPSSQAIVAASTPSTEEANQKELLAKEIQDLFLEKEKYLLKPGWLHFVYKTSLQTGVDRGYLTDGVPFPNDYIIEDWYLIDEENYAITGATFMFDLDGNFLQKSIFSDGTWVNTTLNDSIVTGKFKPLIDLGYLAMVKDSGSVLSKNEVQVEGRSTAEYEISSVYPGSDENTQQIVVKLFFDMKGNLIKTQTVIRNVDGVEVVEDTTDILLIENVQEPSKDVVDYFSEVAK